MIDTPQVTGEAARLGGANDVERGAAGDLGGVIAAAGELHQADVALQHDGLGSGGDAAKAEPGGNLTLVHHPVTGKVCVFEVVHDQRVEILGIGEHVAHHLGIGDARLAVGEGDRAGIVQQADLGHLLAHQPLGHRRHGVDVDQGGVARAPQDEIDQRHVVDHGLGVGHADDGGDAAGGRGLARGRQRLAVLMAGLAGRDHHVDQAGGEKTSAAIDDLRVADG